MSPLSYGVVPFSVNRDARTQPLTITAPAIVKPGEPIAGRASRPTASRACSCSRSTKASCRSRATRRRDPLDFFFRKRMLEVDTAQILDLILPEFSAPRRHGRAGRRRQGDLLAQHLNPFKRKTEKPVACRGRASSTSSGEKEFTLHGARPFQRPLRVIAVAVRTDSASASAETTTTVRGDFVLSPNVPTHVAPGDEFEVPVGVANNLTGLGGKEISVTLSLDVTPGVEVIGDGKPQLDTRRNARSVAVFRLRAKPALGPAKLTFHAAYSDKSAKIRTEVSVRPSSAYRDDLVVGELDKVGGYQTAARDVRRVRRHAMSAHRTSPLVLAQGLSAYLPTSSTAAPNNS